MKIKINQLTGESLAKELMDRYSVIYDQLIGMGENQNISSPYILINRLKINGDVEAMIEVLREIKKLKGQ